MLNLCLSMFKGENLTEVVLMGCKIGSRSVAYELISFKFGVVLVQSLICKDV